MIRRFATLVAVFLALPALAQQPAHMTRDGLNVQYLNVDCYCGEPAPDNGYHCGQIPGGQCGIDDTGRTSAHLELSCPPGTIAIGGSAAGTGTAEITGAWIQPKQVVCQGKSIGNVKGSAHLYCSAVCIEGN